MRRLPTVGKKREGRKINLNPLMPEPEERKRVLRSMRSYYDSRAQPQAQLTETRSEVKETQREVNFLDYAFKHYASIPVKKVLDVACGGGRHILSLAKRGYRVTGVDLSPERIKVAESRARREGVKVNLAVADATKLRLEEQYDAVIGLYMICLLPSEKDVINCLRGMYNALRRGGVAVMDVYNPFSRSKDLSGEGPSWLLKILERGEVFYRQRGPGLRLTEITRIKSFDEVRGVLWLREDSFIEENDGAHSLPTIDYRVRLLTYWDMFHYLKDARFTSIKCHADFSFTNKDPVRARQLVFVAGK